MKVFGIETSCDETSVAIVSDDKKIIANKIYSQIKKHAEHGGVVPEIAARSHIEILPDMIEQVFTETGYSIEDMDAVAVTAGPGLIGGLLVGVMTAKGLAHAAGKPIIPINHLEGHALTVRLTEEVEFPYLLLLISGGHCQILIVHGVGKYTKLGETLDDAIGEAYDKTAKLLGIDYPGGPMIEQYAKLGDYRKFKLPLSMVGKQGCDFSLSGLKTAVRRIVEKEYDNIIKDKNNIYHICASFQYAIGRIIYDRMSNAIVMAKAIHPNITSMVVAGGVASNMYIREILDMLAKQNNMNLFVPPPKLCTDNAAMIAWAGVENFKSNSYNNFDFEPKSNWKLG